jgi:A/G-specific adenine glycosylase
VVARRAGSPALVRAVMDWSDASRRDLPWRRTRDPWAVLVSEVMLQQTQVARVVPRYRAFLAAFPDPSTCAAAPEAAVVEAWAGLGYNRRAVYLHRAAVAVVERHGGRLPSRLDELTKLPGVGPYTARAVLAFAFEDDHGVLDTNSARVLARAVAGHPLTRRDAQALADRLVPSCEGWAWNQAMLDLGATVCVRRAPRCGHCPLPGAGGCAWAGAGRPLPDPAEGSAAASGRQSAFAGSDRQGRGRLVEVLRRGPLPVEQVAPAAGWPDDPDRAARVLAGLVADGLAVDRGGLISLPGTTPVRSATP